MSSPVPFERRVVLSLALLYVFRMLGLFMVLPVLALYGDAYQGSTAFLLGVALGAYGFSQALLQIPFGVLADRIGRKPVIVGGLVLFALGSLVAAGAESVWGLILGRFLQGCGAIAGALMALLSDLTAEENRTKAMALIGASIGVSFALALILGPLLAAWGGLSAIFGLTAVLALVGIYLVIWRLPSAQRSPGRSAVADPGHFWPTLRHRELARLNLGIFTLHFILMASFLVVPLLLEQQLGIHRDSHWQVYTPLLAGSFVAMLPLLLIGERRGHIKLVFLGAIGLLALMELALHGAQYSLWLTLAALFGFFMAFNLLEASLPSLISKVAPAGVKGTAMGIYASSQFFGAFAGGATGGWLLQTGGPGAVLWLCAVLAVLWLAVAAFMRPPRALSSVLVPLRGRSGGDLAERMRELVGVEDVAVVESEQTLHLKVDPRRVDREHLDRLADGRGLV